MKADPKLSFAEQLASFPPIPPDKVAELMAIRERFIQKRRAAGLPEETSIRDLWGSISDAAAKQYLLRIEYSRGHITEDEFFAQGGEW